MTLFYIASDLANIERISLTVHTCPRIFQSILLTKIVSICFVRVLLFTYEIIEMNKCFKMCTQSDSIIIMDLETN